MEGLFPMQLKVIQLLTYMVQREASDMQMTKYKWWTPIPWNSEVTKVKKKHIAMQFNGCNFCQFQHYHNNNYFRAVHNEILDRIDDRKNGAEYQDEISCQFTFDNMRQSKHVSAESNIQLLR